MKQIVAVIALAASPAFAEQPGDFAARAPIEIAAQDALQRIVLSNEVYRHARPDLGDVRIFNAKGDAVPMAFAGEAEPVREVPPGQSLPIFPVTAPVQPSGLPGGIRIREADGTIISIARGQAAPPKGTRVSAWYVDATSMREPLRALEFDWEGRPGTQVIQVSVEASEDLRTWSPIVSNAALVQLAHGGETLGQRRVEFAPRRTKYLRVTAGGDGFELRALLGLPEERLQGLPLQKHIARGAAGDKPGEFVFDLGARLPVESVRLLPVETNTVLVGALGVRDSEKAAWRGVSRLSVYRLTREGREFVSPASSVGRTSARYWRLQLDPGSFGGGMMPPELEVQWRPAQIVFVARGEAPFTLAVGKPDARPAVLPVSNFIPSYERLAELKLPEARIGAMRPEPERAAWRQWVAAEKNRRKLVLWTVLAMGVVVLAFMAWRLVSQMRAQERG